MQVEIGLTSRHRRDRWIVRFLRDHVPVVVRIPGCSLRERSQLALRERLDGRVRERIDDHEATVATSSADIVSTL